MSPPTSRLLPIACCLLLVTAGCSALAGSSEPEFEPVSVDEFVVQNADDEPHTLHVSVVENGTVVYLDSFRLNGTYEGPRGLTAPGSTIAPNPMAEPGNYTVALRIDDGEIERRWLARPGSHLTTCEADESTLVTLGSDDSFGTQIGTSC